MQSAVLVVGAVMVDVVCRVDRLPVSGEGVVVQSSRITVGGCAFNSAHVIHQLGAACTLFAPVGEGIYAEFVARALADHKLSSPIRVHGCDNGLCTCFVEPSGQRTMITTPGVERHFQYSWFDNIAGLPFSHAIINGYEVEGAGGNDIITFFENHPDIRLYYAPGPRIMGVGEQKTSRINALHPVWHLNDQEACAYTGCSSVEDAGWAVSKRTENTVIITTGSQGAHIFDAQNALHDIAFAQPLQVVDTIGAGDAHLGACIAARSKGYSWPDALRIANTLAGEVCKTAGATLTEQDFVRLGIRL